MQDSPDDLTPVVQETQALPAEVKDRLAPIRGKVVTAVDMALEVAIQAMSGQRMTKAQMSAAKMVMPFAPKIEHGIAPVTLILNGIPRPKAPEEVVIDSKPLPESEPIGTYGKGEDGSSIDRALKVK